MLTKLAGKFGKEKLCSWISCFSCKCDLWGQKKVTTDVVSIKQLKRSLEFGLPSFIVFPKEHHTSSSSSLLSSISSRFIYFHCFFLSHYATEQLSFKHPTPSLFSFTYGRHRIQKWFMHFKQVHFMLTKQEEDVFSTFLPFCSERSKPAHDKNRKH